MDDAGLFASNRRIVLSNNDDTKIIEAPIPRSAVLECTKFQLGAYTVFRVLTAAITILAGTMSRSEGRNGVTGRRRRWWSPHKKIAGSNCGLATERVLKEITTIRRVIDYALQSEHTRRPGAYRLRDVCDTCQPHLKSIDLTNLGLAVAVVNELATIPLNFRAREHA
jgi:hypothetical protein